MDQDMQAVDAVLLRFGLDERRAERIVPGGHVNAHWRVPGGPSDFVLRRYHSKRTKSSIAFEHELLRRLGAAWPVAAPVDVGGAGTVEYGGRLWSLFPWLPGGPLPAHGRENVARQGGLLARLHRDLAAGGTPQQREQFSKVWELDAHGWGIGASGITFDELLRSFGRDHPELAAAARRERDRNLRELGAFGYGELPEQPIHGDFAREHLLFDGGRLSGVLDFDLAHVDARASDIAWSMISDCGEPPAETAIDPALAAAFVAGYCAESPLTEQEARLIVPLVRAQDLVILGDALRQWATPAGGAAQLPRIERRIRQRLPQLEERAGAIEAAVMRAAGHAAG
jgi:Ser/Thr protein kinase RdoA (MazF antagonist)